MKKGMAKRAPWSAADRARHKAIREKFQREKPTPEELDASGEYEGPVALGVYLEVKALARALKQARQKSGLSLAQLSQRTEIDPASLSRLENGQQLNPTVETLWRYANGVGLDLALVLKVRNGR